MDGAWFLYRRSHHYDNHFSRHPHEAPAPRERVTSAALIFNSGVVNLSLQFVQSPNRNRRLLNMSLPALKIGLSALVLAVLMNACDHPQTDFHVSEILPGKQQGDYRNHCLGDQRGAVKKRESWSLRSEMPDELVYDSNQFGDSIWCVINYAFDDRGLHNVRTTIHCNNEMNQQRILQEINTELTNQFGAARIPNQWKTLSCVGNEEIISVSDSSLGKAHHTISLRISGQQ